MAENSGIEWTDATVNFWWGCTKVGPGCDHCYAESFDKRVGGAHWGTGAPRRKIKGAVATIHRLDNDYSWWAADASIAGLHPNWRRRVFIQSMSDLFDNEVPLDWFAEAWGKIKVCDRIDIQIVTKRISIVEKRLAAIGEATWPAHAGLMITVVNQAEADRDIPRLLALKAKLGIPWVGLSMEPLLGPVDLEVIDRRETFGPDGNPQPFGVTFLDALSGIDWVIVGGESGPKARPMHPDWARSLRDQCQTAGVSFFFKQWGEYACTYDRDVEDPDWRRCNEVPLIATPGQWLNLAGGQGFHGDRVVRMRKVGKARAGRLLDGVVHDGYPTPTDVTASAERRETP